MESSSSTPQNSSKNTPNPPLPSPAPINQHHLPPQPLPKPIKPSQKLAHIATILFIQPLIIMNDPNANINIGFRIRESIIIIITSREIQRFFIIITHLINPIANPDLQFQQRQDIAENRLLAGDGIVFGPVARD